MTKEDLQKWIISGPKEKKDIILQSCLNTASLRCVEKN